jgi:Flp pilus assembly protein TadG
MEIDLSQLMRRDVFVVGPGQMSVFIKSRMLCQRWIQCKSGSAAVEFSLVCIPFIYLTIAIIEISMFFASANMFETAVSTTSRTIRTGRLQTENPGLEEQAFRIALCDSLYAFINCDNIDVEAIPMPNNTFSEASGFAPVYDEDGRLESQGFDAGSENTVVLIRAAYRYQLWTPLFATIFSNQPDHAIPILSTVVIETEPYL